MIKQLLKDLIVKENEITAIKENLAELGIMFCGFEDQRYHVSSGIKKIFDVADNCFFNFDEDSEFPLKISVTFEGRKFHQMDKIK